MSSSSTDKSLWIGGCCDVSTTLTFNFDLVSDPIDNISTYCTTTSGNTGNNMNNTLLKKKKIFKKKKIITIHQQILVYLY